MKLNSIRHQVAIAGQVSDEKTGQTIQGATVEIIKMPDKFSNKLEVLKKLYGSEWENFPKRPDKTTTTIDGYFYFLDLPEGIYKLSASLPSAGTRYQQRVESQELKVLNHQGNNLDKVVMVKADITLVPTGIEGYVTADSSPLVMAKVWIEGSSEFTFSDNRGYYLLTELETSNIERTVQVAAQGYELAAPNKVKLIQGEIIQNLDLILQKKTPKTSSSSNGVTSNTS
ncbi:MAG: carboxypeptidase-like regulatory domain-containing protein [Nostoc sp. DedQUE12a]|nr:carboxypeptidase-like regulatory domain-containing protein [Nostoc sp. DedQUE12a]